VNSAIQNHLQNRLGVKSELFRELEDQYYPVLKLEDKIQTFTIVGGPRVDLTLKKKHMFCTREEQETERYDTSRAPTRTKNELRIVAFL
jgi:hypothetical protein